MSFQEAAKSGVTFFGIPDSKHTDVAPKPRRRLKDSLADHADGLDVLIQKTKAISVHPEEFESMSLGQDQQNWVNAIYGNDTEQCTWGVKKIRKYVCGEGSEGHAQEVISWNIMSRFLWFLQPELPHGLIFETLWVLTNIAAGPTAHTNIIVEQGFLPYLINLLSHPLISIRTQAAWSIGNIVGDREGFRDLVLQENCLEPLLKIWEGDGDDIAQRKEAFRIAMWVVDNMCRYKPDWHKMGLAFQVLPKVLYESDPYLLKECCWAIARILHQSGRHPVIDQMIVPDICKRLIDILSMNNLLTTHPILRALINLTSSKNALHIQYLLDANILAQLQMILTEFYIPMSCRKSLQVFTIEIVGNIASNPHFYQRCVDDEHAPDLIDRILSFLTNESDTELRTEACICVKNLLFHKNLTVSSKILQGEHNVIESVLSYLQSVPKIGKEHLAGLQCLSYIIEGGGAIAASKGFTVNPYVLEVERQGGFEYLLSTFIESSGKSLENMEEDESMDRPGGIESEDDDSSDDEDGNHTAKMKPLAGVTSNIPHTMTHLSIKDQIVQKSLYVLNTFYQSQFQQRILTAQMTADMHRGFDTMTFDVSGNGSAHHNGFNDLVKELGRLGASDKDGAVKNVPPKLQEGSSEKTLVGV